MKHSRLRLALAIGWPPALVAGIYLAVGRWGFYPDDEGYIQAYSYRILMGQVPHRDFTSPRPLGSALIHLLDFAVPGPLFEVSRIIALLQYTAYAILLAWLIFQISPWRWNLLAACGTAASVLVNLNVFPLMTWYTVDGLLFVAAGCVCVSNGVEKRSPRLIGTGFLLLGMAGLTKQSFAPAPVLGWLLLVPLLRKLPWRARLRRLLLTGVLGALPSVLFVGVIALLGGLPAFLVQVSGASIVYGKPLFDAWLSAHEVRRLGPLVVGVVLLSLCIHLADLQKLGFRAGLAARVGLSALAVAVPVWSRLGDAGNEWSIRLIWMVVAYLLTRAILDRSLDLVSLTLVGAGWMEMLSYGWAWPSFVAGSAVLFLVHRAWNGAEPLSTRSALARMAPLVAGGAALALIGYQFYATRSQHVYLDRPASQLTATLVSVSPAFGDIRTNPQTAEYLRQMADCVRRFPAGRVALLPENAAMYPALSIHNPFPVDWMWPDELHGNRDRILREAEQLNRQGDYLVLFQTIGEPQIVNGTALPAATAQSQIWAYTPIPAEVNSILQGRRTTCGSFLVVYSPPQA